MLWCRPVPVAVLCASALLAGCGSGGSAAGRTPAVVTATVAAGSPATTTAPAVTGAPATAAPTTTTAEGDWGSYHLDAAHTGYDAATPPVGRLATAWTMKTDGAVYASPLVVGGLAVVATEADSVYAADVTTGAPRWHVRLGTPVPVADLPCGNVDPLGITGTPAYDAATGRIFVVAVTRSGGHLVHTLYGLDAKTGTVEVTHAVDAPDQDPDVMNQRGALAVSRRMVYIPYGGHAGDCGSYHGTVVGVATSGAGALVTYRVPTQREAGIWTPGGIAVDGSGDLYVAVGNGAAGQDGGLEDAPYDSSDAVTKLSPDLHPLSSFTPTGWRQENAVDADLGSTGPLLVGPYLWIQGKAATGYVLRQSDLGGIGGSVSTVQACAKQLGGAAAHGMTVYAPCTDGLRQVTIDAAGTAAAGWRAPSSVTGSPVVGGGAVWSLDVRAGVLYALDEATGRVLQTIKVGTVTRFATPALHGALALVPTVTGLTAVSGA